MEQTLSDKEEVNISSQIVVYLTKHSKEDSSEGNQTALKEISSKREGIDRNSRKEIVTGTYRTTDTYTKPLQVEHIIDRPQEI